MYAAVPCGESYYLHERECSQNGCVEISSSNGVESSSCCSRRNNAMPTVLQQRKCVSRQINNLPQILTRETTSSGAMISYRPANYRIGQRFCFCFSALYTIENSTNIGHLIRCGASVATWIDCLPFCFLSEVESKYNVPRSRASLVEQ